MEIKTADAAPTKKPEQEVTPEPTPGTTPGPTPAPEPTPEPGPKPAREKIPAAESVTIHPYPDTQRTSYDEGDHIGLVVKRGQDRDTPLTGIVIRVTQTGDMGLTPRGDRREVEIAAGSDTTLIWFKTENDTASEADGAATFQLMPDERSPAHYAADSPDTVSMTVMDNDWRRAPERRAPPTMTPTPVQEPRRAAPRPLQGWIVATPTPEPTPMPTSTLVPTPEPTETPEPDEAPEPASTLEPAPEDVRPGPGTGEEEKGTPWLMVAAGTAALVLLGGGVLLILRRRAQG